MCEAAVREVDTEVRANALEAGFGVVQTDERLSVGDHVDAKCLDERFVDVECTEKILESLFDIWGSGDLIVGERERVVEDCHNCSRTRPSKDGPTKEKDRVQECLSSEGHSPTGGTEGKRRYRSQSLEPRSIPPRHLKRKT